MWVCHIHSVLFVSVSECVQLIIKVSKKMDEQCQQEFVTQKPHQHNYCQKRFSSLVPCSDISSLFTHTGEEEHQCDYYQKKFTQRSTLREHILTHTLTLGRNHTNVTTVRRGFLHGMICSDISSLALERNPISVPTVRRGFFCHNLQQHILNHTGKNHTNVPTVRRGFLHVITCSNISSLTLRRNHTNVNTVRRGFPHGMICSNTSSLTLRRNRSNLI